MIIDSVVWIALKSKRDQWHDQAVKLKEKILSLDKIFITDFIILETYNFLLRKVSYSAAQETLSMFLQSPKISILYNNHISITGSNLMLQKYNQLSLTDANIIWFTNNLNIKEILSFDKGFEGISEVKRIT